MLSLTALPGSAARAEDFCDTNEINSKIANEPGKRGDHYYAMENDVQQEKDEKEVRAKCKVGDIIAPYNIFMAARLCDLNKPMAGHELCFLAPPRKTY